MVTVFGKAVRDMRKRDDDHMLPDTDIDGRNPSDGHARFRPPSHIRTIALAALVCAILGIGGNVCASRASSARESLASECSKQTDLMNAAYYDLRDKITLAKESTDTSVLSSRTGLAAQWKQVTRLSPVPLINCETSLHNKELQANTQAATQQREQYLAQNKKLEALEVKVANMSERTAKRTALKQLTTALTDAHTVLERTEDMELKVPYLRTRLSQLAVQGQQLLDDKTSSTSQLQDCAVSLESMTQQVSESAGLISGQQSDDRK